MTPGDVPAEAPVTVLHFDEERARAVEDLARGTRQRSARTLVKNGPLRVTLIELAPGGTIAEHQAEGPITVQPLRGSLSFSALGEVLELSPGHLVSLDARVRHAVSTKEGATFLLTLVAP